MTYVDDNDIEEIDPFVSVPDWMIQMAPPASEGPPEPLEDAENHGDQGECWQPFPTAALPPPLSEYVQAGATAIGCDEAMLALPLLTMLGAAIGNTRRLRLKRGWRVPPILWGAIVGDSGTGKTPAFQMVLRPIRERQARLLQDHDRAMEEYNQEKAAYDRDMAAWKKSKSPGPPPEPPPEPVAQRLLVSDVTIESVAAILECAPRGLLLIRDELATWFGSFDRYGKTKGGADAAHWLSMYNAESLLVDRKTADKQTITVLQAAVAITGGVQPQVLDRALGRENRENGLAARLLLAWPPRKPRIWTEDDMPDYLEERLAALLDGLLALRPKAEEPWQPVTMGLTQEAKAEWTAFFNAHGKELAALTSDLAAAWSKLEETAGRLALILHCCRQAYEDTTAGQDVDRQSMEAAITITHWAKRETRRVYHLLAGPGEAKAQADLVAWIKDRGGKCTVRDLQRGRWAFRNGPTARKALAALAASGKGTMAGNQFTLNP